MKHIRFSSQISLNFNNHVTTNFRYLKFSYKIVRSFSSDKEQKMEFFLNEFYSLIRDKKENLINYNYNKKSSYYSEVFRLLDIYKEKKIDSYQELEDLQDKIESLTFHFDDEKSLFQRTPELCDRFISKDKVSAKDYIKSKININNEDFTLLNFFDHYTLEAIMIYSLSRLFYQNENIPAVRVSTLIEHLTNIIRKYAYILQARMNKSEDIYPAEYLSGLLPSYMEIITKVKDKKEKEKKVQQYYQLGKLLLEFMIERDILKFENDLGIDAESIQKKKEKYYYNKKLYVICNFDMELLPIKQNLPMVCIPKKWESVSISKKPKSLSDMNGGYRNNVNMSSAFNMRYSLQTSRDIDHFYIQFNNYYQELIEVMNDLQYQSFEINSDVLKFMKENSNLLVQLGLLKPQFLASLNVSESINLLRKTFLENPDIKKICKFHELNSLFMKDLQRSRYENFIINLASAYEGYKFYLPAFLDFRGRIYRAGIFHFHERDIARSLIVFTTKKKYDMYEEKKQIEIMNVLHASAAFHFQKFHNYIDAYQWYFKQDLNSLDDESLIKFSVKASSPYQFISKILTIKGGGKIDPTQIPITQDASASAYQISGYLLLNDVLAKYTNLHSSPDIDHIYDIYENLKSSFVNELKESNIFNADLTKMICDGITRKLIKSLFMPIIYGKTVLSMSNDIYNHYKSILNQKESRELASKASKFFYKIFPSINLLMNLIRGIAWVCSTSNQSVRYEIPYLITVQDYLKDEPVSIWVYDRSQGKNKKRRQVILRIPKNEKDRRKTLTSTFANFIHQKDANIAMFMIKNLIKEVKAPIYTVHDNFITTAPYISKVPYLYNDVLIQGPDPLFFINDYIKINLFDRDIYNNYLKEYRSFYKNQLGLCPFIESNPLPYNLFKKLLESQIPEKISKKERKVWDVKITEILDLYYTFLNTVYNVKENDLHRGYSNGYKKKLDEFKKKLKIKEDDNKFYYSVHL